MNGEERKVRNINEIDIDSLVALHRMLDTLENIVTAVEWWADEYA